MKQTFFSFDFAPFLNLDNPSNLINLATLINCRSFNFASPWSRLTCASLSQKRVNELVRIFQNETPENEKPEHQKNWVRDAILSIECIASNESLISAFLQPYMRFPPYFLSHHSAFAISKIPTSVTRTYFERLQTDPSQWISDSWCRNLDDSTVLSFYGVAERFVSPECYSLASGYIIDDMLTESASMASEESNNWVLTTLRLLQMEEYGPIELNYIKNFLQRDKNNLTQLIDCILESRRNRRSCEKYFFNMLTVVRYKQDIFVCHEIMLLYIQKTSAKLSDRMINIAQDLLNGIPLVDEQSFCANSNKSRFIIPYYSAKLIKGLMGHKRYIHMDALSVSHLDLKSIWEALSEIDRRLLPAQERYVRMLRANRMQETNNSSTLYDVYSKFFESESESVTVNQACSKLTERFLNLPTKFEDTFLEQLEHSVYIPQFEPLIHNLMLQLCTSEKIDLFKKSEESSLSPPYVFRDSNYLKMYFHGLAYAIRHRMPLPKECHKFTGSQLALVLKKLPRFIVEILKPYARWGFPLEEYFDEIIQWV